MISQLLIVSSALIVFTLGTVHLVYTFSTDKLSPRDRSLRVHMEKSHPVLTSQTTMWRAWVGFNASHSLGAMMFGYTYAFLAISNPSVLLGSWPLLGAGVLFLASLLFLARAYWFKIPFNGVLLSLGLFMAGIVAA